MSGKNAVSPALIEPHVFIPGKNRKAFSCFLVHLRVRLQIGLFDWPGMEKGREVKDVLEETGLAACDCTFLITVKEQSTVKAL